MPGETANPLAPHRVPLVRHRAASDLRLLKRLLHLLVGGKVVFDPDFKVFFLGNLHAGKQSDVCANLVGRGSEGGKSSQTICVHLIFVGCILKTCFFSLQIDDVSDLAGVSLSSDHVTAGEAGLCSHQLVKLLHLEVRLLLKPLKQSTS